MLTTQVFYSCLVEFLLHGGFSSNDWGLYGFVQMLEYKCLGYGKELNIINTFSYV